MKSKMRALSIPPVNEHGIPILALRSAEAALALGVSERHLWSLTNRGLVPSLKLGRAIVYPVDGLREWMAETAGEVR